MILPTCCNLLIFRTPFTKGRCSLDTGVPTLQEMSDMGPGTVFSKVAVLCNVPQLFTVRTREVCELLKLDKNVLARILQAYPKDSRQMLDNLKKVRSLSSRGRSLVTMLY